MIDKGGKMRCTAKNVLIETTNVKDGCLHCGSRAGVVMAYAIDDVSALLDVAVCELRDIDIDAPMAGYVNRMTARQLIGYHLSGRCIRRGIAIG